MGTAALAVEKSFNNVLIHSLQTSWLLQRSLEIWLVSMRDIAAGHQRTRSKSNLENTQFILISSPFVTIMISITVFYLQSFDMQVGKVETRPAHWSGSFHLLLAAAPDRRCNSDGFRSVKVKVWKCESVKLKVWKCESVKVWMCESESVIVKVWT